MARCKWCNKKGFFLKLSVNELCDECNPIIVNKILENAEKYKKSIVALMHYISPKEGLELIDTLKSSLNLLRQYELKGIPTIQPLPSELLKQNIYSSRDETIEDAERRVINENNKLKNGILNLDCQLFCNDVIELTGDFIYDEKLRGFVQFCTNEPNPSLAKWCFYDKQLIEFSEDFNSGYYREYYPSGKLRREMPFIRESNSKSLQGNGTEKLYYMDADSNGEETYTLIEENLYKNGERCGIGKKYSIDGGLMEETNYDTIIFPEGSPFYGCDRKEYYPESGKLKLENYKEWGKEYYPNGSLKGEWTNNNYLKVGKYFEYHENGKLKVTVSYFDGINRDGLMHKYFENGNLKELWSYDKGKRKFVKKFFENGVLKTEWLYDDGNEISKIYYDENGKLRVKHNL